MASEWDTHTSLTAAGDGLFGADLDVHVRAVPAPGWLKVSHRTRNVAGGMFEEGCEVWDSAGRLVAQSRQLALQPRS